MCALLLYTDKNNDTEVLAAVKNLNAILKTKTDKIRHDLKGMECNKVSAWVAFSYIISLIE